MSINIKHRGLHIGTIRDINDQKVIIESPQAKSHIIVSAGYYYRTYNKKPVVNDQCVFFTAGYQSKDVTTYFDPEYNHRAYVLYTLKSMYKRRQPILCKVAYAISKKSYVVTYQDVDFSLNIISDKITLYKGESYYCYIRSIGITKQHINLALAVNPLTLFKLLKHTSILVSNNLYVGITVNITGDTSENSKYTLTDYSKGVLQAVNTKIPSILGASFIAISDNVLYKGRRGIVKEIGEERIFIWNSTLTETNLVVLKMKMGCHVCVPYDSFILPGQYTIQLKSIDKTLCAGWLNGTSRLITLRHTIPSYLLPVTHVPSNISVSVVMYNWTLYIIPCIKPAEIKQRLAFIKTIPPKLEYITHGTTIQGWTYLLQTFKFSQYYIVHQIDIWNKHIYLKSLSWTF